MKITTQIQHHFPIRRSVALIGAAILLTTVTANAEVKIGRLPSTSESGGKVIGAKPNVFIIIDNSKSMTGSSKKSELDPDGNLLQQTAGALIAALPQLEGKVRLGYTTIFRGVNGISQFNRSCKDYKLNGNVNRLNKFIPGLKDDLIKNKNYFLNSKDSKDYYIFGQDGTEGSTGEDLIFGEYGSGYGDTVPRDFKDNYARYIYAWLGGMCMGNTSNRDSLPYTLVPQKSQGYPPYADLRDPKNYVTAAAKSGNKYSYPLFNFFGSNIIKKSHKPLVDMYTRVLGEVSDENFLCSIVSSRKGPRCGYTNLNAERNSPNNLSLRGFPSAEPFNFFNYDAYADAVPEHEGYPDDKNPKSCRKNYTIMIAYGPYGAPESLKNNSTVGVGQWGIFGAGGSHSWEMPNGHDIPTSGALGDYTRIYRHLPLEGVKGSVREIPKSSYVNNGKTYNVQGTAGRFLLSKLILETYYGDLRSNLMDDVAPFYAQKSARPDGIPGVNGGKIPIMWDRKNDTATWQHMAFFALGFKDSFPTWKKAAIYQKNFSNLDPEGGILEGYFRAIENGSIYAENSPLYDWGRGGFGLESEPMNYYIYKKPGNVSPPTEKVVIADDYPADHYLEAFGALNQMDYAKAGVVGRGGAYDITDYNSIKKIIGMIADRIETAMAQEVSGAGAVGGGSRVTASAQSAGGNNSTLFTTYIDEASTSGNLFAYRNCPLIEKEKDGKLNPDWIKGQCGQRLWNAASALDKDKSKIATKTIIPVDLTVDPSNPRPLVGKAFTWDNLDADLRKALQDGSNTESDIALGKARLAWLNGKTREDVAKDTDSAVASAASKLRARPIIQIPVEGQRYELDKDGNPVRDEDGNYTLLKKDAANTPNRIGEIVYATAKTVDPRGTLKAGHPLNLKGNKDKPNDMSNYGNFIVKNVRDGKNEKRKPLVIVGANDGRLYGFTNPKDGSYAELAFSYIPRKVITDGRLKATTKDSWSSATAESLVNGPFTVTDAQVDNKWGTYLVGTLGAGGSTVYALDISNGEAKFKWEIDLDNGGANTMSAPRIVWLREKCSETPQKCEPKGKWVVLLPSGYNAKDTSLIVLDLKDGSVISRIKTGADYQAIASESSEASVSTQFCSLKPLTSADKSNSNLQKLHDRLDSLGDITLPKQSNITCDNGLGDLTVTDADGDGGADYVYAGDLLGYVWKFNLTGFDFANPKNSELTVEYDAPLFVAETQEDLRQPITNMIEIGDGPFGEGSMMYFGTGRLFNQEERNITERQSFYGVWENPRYINQVNGFTLPLRRSAAGVYGFWRYEPRTLKNGEYTLSDNSSLKDFKEIRVVERIDNLPPRAKSINGKVANVEPEVENFLSYDGSGQRINSATAQAIGWVIDFPEETSKERVLDRARTFEDMIFFSSFTPKTNDASGEENVCTSDKPSIGGEGRFYMLNRLTGAPLAQSPFDFNGNGQNDKEGDNIKVNSSVVGSNTTSVATDDNNEVSLSPASIKFNGSANFVELEAVLAQGSKRQAFCDYTRQVIFPGTADPKTGDPLSLTGCYQNRYRVWKQPVSK